MQATIFELAWIIVGFGAFVGLLHFLSVSSGKSGRDQTHLAHATTEDSAALQSTRGRKQNDPLTALIEKYHHLREDYHIQQRILEVSNTILAGGPSAATMEEAFAMTLATCQKAFGGDTSTILLVDEETRELMGVATDKKPYNSKGHFRISLDESALSVLAFNGATTVAITDVINDPRVNQRIRRIFNARSGIATPLLVDKKPIGVLMTMMQHVHVEFTPRDHSLLEGLASVAAVAVHTQMLHKRRIQLEHRFQRLIETAPLAIFVIDEQRRIVETNKATLEMFGYGPTDLVGRDFQALFHIDSATLVEQQLTNRNDEQTMHFEAALLSADGVLIPVEVDVSHLSILGCTVTQAFVRDIRSRRAAEEALREEKERAEITLRSIGDAVITTDAGGCIETLNPAAEVLLGRTDAKGRAFGEVIRLLSTDNDEPVPNPVETCIGNNTVVDIATRLSLARSNDSKADVELSTAPIRDAFGNPAGTVTTIHDVTQAQKMAEEMSYLATHDTLTGLVNRGEFEARVRRAIASAKNDQRQHAICYIDLDRFKMVNDTSGHGAGDELLRQLTAHLRTAVRESDTLSRLGGDEFALLLENCPLERAADIAERIRLMTKDYRFCWDGKSFDIGASIGVAAITQNSGDLKEVMHAVDSACYLAKEQGRNRVRVFTIEDTELTQQVGQAQWSQRIQHAIANDRFELYAQEIVPFSMDQQDVVHYEILLRMLDEDGNIIQPGAFIPAAERYCQMPEIDRWVVKHTLQAISAHGQADTPFVYSVNLSGQSLSDNETLDYIVAQLEASGVNPAQICFEVTETAAIANLVNAVRFIEKLKQVGCKFALDDFGSGLSSFGYLKSLPVDYLKIDGCFVKEMIARPVDFAMVEAINKIGHVMNIKTIAEFVGNDETVSALKSIGVDFGQGFGLSMPCPLTQYLPKIPATEGRSENPGVSATSGN